MVPCSSGGFVVVLSSKYLHLINTTKVVALLVMVSPVIVSLLEISLPPIAAVSVRAVLALRMHRTDWYACRILLHPRSSGPEGLGHRSPFNTRSCDHCSPLTLPLTHQLVRSSLLSSVFYLFTFLTTSSSRSIILPPLSLHFARSP